jgi:hypothetical protein
MLAIASLCRLFKKLKMPHLPNGPARATGDHGRPAGETHLLGCKLPRFILSFLLHNAPLAKKFNLNDDGKTLPGSNMMLAHNSIIQSRPIQLFLE